MTATVLPMTLDLEHPLTPREIEILEYISEGFTRDETAEELDISLSTVKTHLQRILAKTGTHSQAEAVAWAFRAGVIS